MTGHKHATIPVFVPHLACPNQCVFCNQKRISGALDIPEDPYPMLREAAKGLSDRFDEVDIAFFGGSFTGIGKEKMTVYLSTANRIRREFPKIRGLRLSTRPDYIDEEIVSFLLSFGVTAVELGVQSLDDRVLTLSGRGHSAADTVQAVSLLRRTPFEIVLQLMPGLPGDTLQTIRQTAQKAAELVCDAVRIYPCVVIRDTPLAESYQNGTFTPLSLESAVEICADMAEFFREREIRILRMGLHSSDLVENGGVIAGPFHPAFGEMVEQRLALRKICRGLTGNLSGKEKKGMIFVPPGRVSKTVGQKRANLSELKRRYGIDFSVKEDLLLSGEDFRLFFE